MFGTKIPAPTPKQVEKGRFAVALTLRIGNGVYEGTVPAHVKARRRASNKVARASRKANR